MALCSTSRRQSSSSWRIPPMSRRKASMERVRSWTSFRAIVASAVSCRTLARSGGHPDDTDGSGRHQP
jgi:hypothetical protein